MRAYESKLLRSSLLFWGFIILTLFGIVGLCSLSISDTDQELHNSNSALRIIKHKERKSDVDRELTKQVRYHVTKRMWLSEKIPRLELELQGSRSVVAIFTRRSEARLHETFYDVQGTTQQELFYKDQEGKEYVYGENGQLKRRGENEPTIDPERIHQLQPFQRFRYFEAENAVYDYHTHTLIAYDVNFWIYTAEGHELITDRSSLWPESSGSAASMTMCHEGSLSTVQFSAENLSMQVTPEW